MTVILLLGALADTGWAGPPYLTDDPVPTDQGRWEVFLYGEGTHSHHASEGETGFDINYGAARDLQLTVALPLAFEHGDRLRSGLGDVELGAKYEFVHQAKGSPLPDIGFFPTMTIPTARKGFGSGKVGLSLPLFAQKDSGDWSVFGGGGYTLNPGAGNRNYWSIGTALTRQVTDRVNLGSEIFHSGPEERGGVPSTALGIGLDVGLDDRWSLLASAHSELQHRRANGRYGLYLAIAFAN